MCLSYPMHGKGSSVDHLNAGVFRGIPNPFRVGRYHSLYANRETFPVRLEITAESDDGIIMGIRHRTLPIEAVQFHPESILSLEGDCGLALDREHDRSLHANCGRAPLALSSSPRVAMIGGGLAGLASAVALGSADYNVSLYEARPFLGGRATSYP